MKKICFAASSGGHLSEVLQLERISADHETILLTEHTDFQPAVWMKRVYFVPQVNRREVSCLFKLLSNLMTTWKMLRRERPDVVISTGALATIPACYLAHWMKIKVIYIESFARTNSASKAGLVINRIADCTFVQWKDVQKYLPNAVYGGTVY